MTMIAYCIYLIIALGMTIWVAWTLSHNGKVYLVRCFKNDAELATSINHLLVVGFYLVNFGFIALALSTAGEVATGPETMRFLGWYVGLAVLVLGFMHFFNMGAVTRHGRNVANWMREEMLKEGPAPAEALAQPIEPKQPAKTVQAPIG